MSDWMGEWSGVDWIPLKLLQLLEHLRYLKEEGKKKKSRNGDTLGPVELNVRLEQSNQGDRCEQDD